jgi:hypothetical protein
MESCDVTLEVNADVTPDTVTVTLPSMISELALTISPLMTTAVCFDVRSFCMTDSDTGSGALF